MLNGLNVEIPKVEGRVGIPKERVYVNPMLNMWKLPPRRLRAMSVTVSADFHELRLRFAEETSEVSKTSEV